MALQTPHRQGIVRSGVKEGKLTEMTDWEENVGEREHPYYLVV